MEVEKQVAHALVVIVVIVVKMELEKPEKVLFKDIFVRVAGIGLANHQSY